MKRVVEPELMDDAQQAVAYAQADFSEPNTLFIDLLVQHCATPPVGHCLDLGCGPGDICFRIADKFPELNILGIDGAEAMLALARQEPRPKVSFEQHRLPSDDLPNNYFDVITSNSLLHHLHDPDVLWQAIRTCGKPGCQILIMDLYRPDSEADATAIVARYAADEAEILKTDFYHSLCAAFTPDEIAQQLITAGITNLDIEIASDRHVIISGQL